MSLEAALAQDQSDEPLLTTWKVTIKDGTTETVKSSLDALVAPIVHSQDPRIGVVTYAYSVSINEDSKEKDTVHFTELFSDLGSFQNHLTGVEGEAMVDLFESIQDRVVGYVNAPTWHEGVQEGIKSSQAQATRTTAGHVLTPYYPKSLLGGKWGRRLIPSSQDAVMLELRIHPDSTESADRLISILTPLTKITKTDLQLVSSHIVRGPGWWRRDPVANQVHLKTRDASIPRKAYTTDYSSADTIEFRALYSHCNIRHMYPRRLVRQLAELLQASKRFEFIVTAVNWEHEILGEVLEYFQDQGLVVTDSRKLLSGFLLHPFFTKDWEGTTELVETTKAKPVTERKPNMAKPAPTASSTSQVDSGCKDTLAQTKTQKPPKSIAESDSNVFSVRRHAVKDQPEALILETRARMGPSTTPSGDVVIPLLDYLRTTTRLTHADKEIPIGTLFGVLERMRSTQTEVAYINSLVQMTDSEREEKGNVSRVQAFFQKLNLMGRGEYQKDFGTKRLVIDGLDDLIRAIEREYSVVVKKAQEAVANEAAMEYLGLQELYKIGSIVTTRSIPGLSGLLVSFKVVDCLYEPIRSLMGGLRYSFKTTLETIVYTGQHFIAVPFTETIGDWKNVKDIVNLPFQPVTGPTAWITERISKVNSLHAGETSYSYMEYPAGSFFPSLGGKASNKSTGAASSSVMRAAAGQVIVDIKTGLNLGYSPSSRTGELGMAMGYIMKFYLDFIRKTTHANADLDELNNAGYLTAYENFPTGIGAQPWPCVIGFSMTTKSWGYTVVDGLVPVLPDPRPWSELVLPPSSREMLMSLAQEKIQGNGSARYRYNDIIAGKGSGGLYLLYGPPGCGKTLTVEALARFFGKPLYSISFAELGSSSAELEEKLTVTLGLAAHWGSLVLLDEGDALVEKRKQGQLLLNSMTGVLLRLLETFEGSLFINSNRVSSFDPAALSRVTLAVKFSPLTRDGMRQIWQNTIARVLCSDTTQDVTWEDALQAAKTQFDLHRLSDFPGSGRSVGAVMKMAIALCSHRQCDLTEAVLFECVNNFLSFHNDLKGEGVSNKWDEGQ